MIGVVEMLKVAQQIIEANRMSSPNAAFGVFLVVFVLYFFACGPSVFWPECWRKSGIRNGTGVGMRME